MLLQHFEHRCTSLPLPTDRDLGSCYCQSPVPKLLRVGSWWPPTWGAAVGWTASHGWTPGWTACAMSNHGCCAAAGMLLLPHGTHLHPSCAPACLAGTWSTTTCLLHAARQRRQRGAEAAVLVMVYVRSNACHCCGMLQWT